MQMTGNTILITGGASGIGRGLAEAFHRLDNQVIISGRRQAALDAATKANPGMEALQMDISTAEGVRDFARRALQAHPGINVLINNAGIMTPEDLTSAPDYLETAEATIATNLLGPIRLTAALLPHLQQQPHAAVLMVSSGLAFVPLAATPTYSATKAALHSYSVSLRHQLQGSGVAVIEVAPPYVQTELMGAQQASDPLAMNLQDFLTEVMDILANKPDAPEVIVGRCAPLRFAAENGKMAEVFAGLNGHFC